MYQILSIKYIRNLTILSVFFVLLATCYLLFATEVRADSFSVGVYPPVTRLRAQPERNVEAPISLYNFLDKEINLEILLKPFVAVGQTSGTIKYYKDERIQNFLEQNVHVFDQGDDVKEITIAPKQKKTFRVVISVPKEEKEGDYYFSVIFLQKDQPRLNRGQNISENIQGGQSTEARSQILGGIATNILLFVKPSGTITPKANSVKIEEFSSPTLVNATPVSFKIKIKNNDSHFVSLQGYILIKNIFGQTIGKLDLAKSDIIAGELREYSLDWKEKLLIGPYNARFIILLADNGPAIERNNYFLAFPTKYLAYILVIGVTITIITMRVKRRIKG